MSAVEDDGAAAAAADDDDDDDVAVEADAAGVAGASGWGAERPRQD